MAPASVTETPVAPVPDGNKSTDSNGIPDGAAPIRLPVMVVEGMETADGRFIEPGALSTRTLPIALYSQVRSSHGSLDGDTATVLAGAITHATRRPGPEVTQLSTGQPFPEGTFVWEGTGWMYQDVPAPPEKPAYQLVKDKALRGNSVDLSEVDATFEYEDGQNPAEDPNPRRIVITSGVIGATTLVGQPAFPDAFIELDGTAMPLAGTPENFEVHERNGAGDAVLIRVVRASAVPAWRAAEVGDKCGPCLAETGPHDEAITAALGYEDPGEASAFAVENIMGDDVDPDDITPRHTGGMIALVPSNPNMLRVPDGDPAHELHLTLCYLGDNVTEWPPELAMAVHRIARELTDFDAQVAAAVAQAEARDEDPAGVAREFRRQERTPAQRGPLEANIFAHSVFNPNGDKGFEPASVYLFDGGADRNAIEALASEVGWRVRDAIGDVWYPEQHSPYIPHVTAGYDVPVANLTYTGPVEFDRLRVALGDRVTDYPLGGGPIVASGINNGVMPPAAWFANPQLTGPTPPTVGEMTHAGAPIYGHLACWDTCHIGFAGKCVTPPRSHSSYAYFMVHSTQALNEDGELTEIPVGWGTMETGHADVRQGAQAAAEHYDNTGTVAFELAVGEDDHGIWFAGRMLPHLSEPLASKARGVAFSGDWRTIRGKLELVASLAVNVPGFPVPRVRVASGQPVALVAAAVPHTITAAQVKRDTLSQPELRELLDYVRAERDGKRLDAQLAYIAEVTDGVDEAVEWSIACQLADIGLAIEGDHPWFGGGHYSEMDEAERGEDEAFAKRKNWVAKAGGLPTYIKRIVKHLRAKGMNESRAIATAKNAAQKMCDSGDTNFPGKQDANPGSRAEACAAVAEWNAKRKAGST